MCGWLNGYWVVVDVLVWESGEPNPWAFVCPQIPAPPHQPSTVYLCGRNWFLFLQLAFWPKHDGEDKEELSGTDDLRDREGAHGI